MAEEKREPGVVRYKAGRLKEKWLGRLFCLFGRHRFREEGVTICMRCLKQMKERYE